MALDIKYGVSTWLWTSPFSTASIQELFDSMETTQHPRNREEEAAKAKARSAERFGARN